MKQLATMSRGELEHAWMTLPCSSLPRGVWQARVLHELPMWWGKRMLSRAMFSGVFGMNLDTQQWWFKDLTRQVARFEPRAGRSRWRDADVIQLHYERTGPPLLRGILYDELKPLNDNCILGIGGSNRDDDGGTWFFFAMSPVPVL